MVYLVETSDGKIHSTFDEGRYVAWQDMFGPEVLHTAVIDDDGNRVEEDALRTTRAKRPRAAEKL